MFLAVLQSQFSLGLIKSALQTDNLLQVLNAETSQVLLSYKVRDKLQPCVII